MTAVIAKGAGFQPNDVVAVLAQGGSLGTAVAVELDEFGSTRFQTAPLNVLSIPSSGINKLTIGGSDQFEGSLKLSGDGNYLTLGGIDANAGTVNIGGMLSPSNPVVVGRVTVSNGTIDLSTKIHTSATLFGAITSNGTDIWVKGTSGVGYTSLGSSTMTALSQTYTPGGAVGIFGGQLYTTSENSTLYTLAAVGSGLPKVSSPETPLPGFTTADYDHRTNDFWFRDASTLYLTESSSFDVHPGVQKWTFNGAIWQYQYNVFTSAINYLSGWVDPSGNTALFGTSGTTNDNLLRIVDGGSQALSTSSVLATAAPGTSFHGVAFIPVPEPAALAIMALGTAAVFVVARRRRGKRRRTL
jgi:hypothetical protein